MVFGTIARRLVVASAFVVLAGCTVFDDDEVTPPGSDQPYPNLGSVPDAAGAAETPASRAAIAEGLVADKKNAEYADQVVRKLAVDDTTIPAPAAPSSASAVSASIVASGGSSASSAPALEAPAPPAVPATPVQQAEVVALAPVAPAAPAATAAPAPLAPAPAPALGASAPAAVGLGVVGAPGVTGQTYQAMLAESASATTIVGAPTVPAATTFVPSTAAPILTPPVGVAPSIAPGGATVVISSATHGTGSSGTGGSKLAVTGGGENLFDTFVGGVTGAAIGGTAGKIATVQFGNGSAALTGAARRQLREVAKIQRQRGGTLRIVGHSSARTQDMSFAQHQLVNFELSLKRANAVAADLLKLGVKSEAIIVGSRSDSEPLFYEVMPSGEAGNRRAEIFIDY